MTEPARSTQDENKPFDEQIGVLLESALEYVPQYRRPEIARSLLPQELPEEQSVALLLTQNAVIMATELALFTPNKSGATAFDRFCRDYIPTSPQEAMIVDRIRHSRLRLLQIRFLSEEGAPILRDVLSEENFHLFEDEIGPEFIGSNMLLRPVLIDGSRAVVATYPLLLDEKAMAIVKRYIRPGRRELLNPLRCAEASYRYDLGRGGVDAPVL